jgi:hypothetical protein
MIVPIRATETRHHLAVESPEQAVASVEVLHERDALRQREVVRIRVTLDDPDVDVITEVRSA